jgi:tetratricopeptide (TPR) repeat protein
MAVSSAMKSRQGKAAQCPQSTTEDAVSLPRLSFSVSRKLVLGTIAGALVFTGCAELITYSNKSYDQGQKLLAQGRLEDAAGAFRNATQQNPRHYQSFFALGQTYEKLGREQQALQSYRAALDVMPAPIDAKDYAFRDQAINGYANCIATSASRDAELAAQGDRASRTRSAVDYYVLARAYVYTGDADNAIDAYDRALLASESRDASIAKSFGLYLAQINQGKRAEAVLTKAYQLNPGDAEVTEALRKLGVVPGPSLLEPNQLHSPLVPKGPIPELEINVKDKNKPASEAP